MLQADLDQPIELVFRGDAVDVLGVMMSVLADPLEEGTDNARMDMVVEDISEQLNQRVNLGYYEREAKRAMRNDDIPGYRGVQVLVEEFNPQHPRLPGDAGVDNLTPLEEANAYVVIERSGDGYEMGGYPDQFGLEQSLQFASMLRMYARELEELVDRGSVDYQESSDE